MYSNTSCDNLQFDIKKYLEGHGPWLGLATKWTMESLIVPTKYFDVYIGNSVWTALCNNKVFLYPISIVTLIWLQVF